MHDTYCHSLFFLRKKEQLQFYQSLRMPVKFVEIMQVTLLLEKHFDLENKKIFFKEQSNICIMLHKDACVLTKRAFLFFFLFLRSNCDFLLFLLVCSMIGNAYLLFFPYVFIATNQNFRFIQKCFSID